MSFNFFFSGGVSGLKLDPDAKAYIAAVEAADGAKLEKVTKLAINAFVVGCKSDGIWTAIKACCILAGARTITGALVPLAGDAPTNFNFVSGDYNRKTGLVGDGSTKYLNSNRADNSSTATNRHAAVYESTPTTLTTNTISLGVNPASGNGGDTLLINNAAPLTATRLSNETTFTIASAQYSGFFGASRSLSTSYTARINGTSITATQASSASLSAFQVFVFAQNNNGGVSSFTNARLSFYSIGEDLDISLLDARVSTLMSQIGAAI